MYINNVEYFIQKEKYMIDYGYPCINIVAADGEPYGRLTVNIPDVELQKDEIVVKTWSEND